MDNRYDYDNMLIVIITRRYLTHASVRVTAVCMSITVTQLAHAQVSAGNSGKTRCAVLQMKNIKVRKTLGKMNSVVGYGYQTERSN